MEAGVDSIGISEHLAQSFWVENTRHLRRPQVTAVFKIPHFIQSLNAYLVF